MHRHKAQVVPVVHYLFLLFFRLVFALLFCSCVHMSALVLKKPKTKIQVYIKKSRTQKSTRQSTIKIIELNESFNKNYDACRMVQPMRNSISCYMQNIMFSAKHILQFFHEPQNAMFCTHIPNNIR